MAATTHVLSLPGRRSMCRFEAVLRPGLSARQGCGPAEKHEPDGPGTSRVSGSHGAVDIQFGSGHPTSWCPLASARFSTPGSQ